jgi:hypothetical protein
VGLREIEALVGVMEEEEEIVRVPEGLGLGMPEEKEGGVRSRNEDQSRLSKSNIERTTERKKERKLFTGSAVWISVF